jgi:hypothetical protein
MHCSCFSYSCHRHISRDDVLSTCIQPRMGRQPVVRQPIKHNAVFPASVTANDQLSADVQFARWKGILRRPLSVEYARLYSIFNASQTRILARPRYQRCCEHRRPKPTLDHFKLQWMRAFICKEQVRKQFFVARPVQVSGPPL